MSTQPQLIGRVRAAAAWAKQLEPQIVAEYRVPVEPVIPFVPQTLEGEPAGRARVAAVFARQFAPKPASVPPRTAIPQTFAASRTAVAAVPLGVILGGLRASATQSNPDSIRKLIRAGGLDQLLVAREQIETLPSDHPEGRRLVNELFDALGKLSA